jgi:hypothetical protein
LPASLTAFAAGAHCPVAWHGIWRLTRARRSSAEAAAARCCRQAAARALRECGQQAAAAAAAGQAEALGLRWRLDDTARANAVRAGRRAGACAWPQSASAVLMLMRPVRAAPVHKQAVVRGSARNVRTSARREKRRLARQDLRRELERSRAGPSGAASGARGAGADASAAEHAREERAGAGRAKLARLRERLSELGREAGRRQVAAALAHQTAARPELRNAPTRAPSVSWSRACLSMSCRTHAGADPTDCPARLPVTGKQLIIVTTALHTALSPVICGISGCP